MCCASPSWHCALYPAQLVFADEMGWVSPHPLGDVVADFVVVCVVGYCSARYLLLTQSGHLGRTSIGNRAFALLRQQRELGALIFLISASSCFSIARLAR